MNISTPWSRDLFKQGRYPWETVETVEVMCVREVSKHVLEFPFLLLLSLDYCLDPTDRCWIHVSPLLPWQYASPLQDRTGQVRYMSLHPLQIKSDEI